MHVGDRDFCDCFPRQGALHTVPTYEGYAAFEAILSLSLAGRDVTALLANFFVER